MKKLVLIFPDAETRSDWVGWYLDGNGEQDFLLSQEEHNRPQLMYAKPPAGETAWDWKTRGEDAEEHRIAIEEMKDEP